MHASASRLTPLSARLIAGCRRKRWTAPRAFFAIQSKRSMHIVHERRELPYPIEDGVGDFLPPDALKTVVEWQDGLLQRLSDQVRGTDVAKSTILQTMIDSAGKQDHIMAFNYASLAANNSFFLDNLKPPGTQSNESELSYDLKSAIVKEFANMDSLKARFVASATGMTSSGWLWLVTDDRSRLAIIPTFGAGSLLARSHKYFKEVEQDTLVRQPLNWLSEPLEEGPTETGIFPGQQSGLSPTSPVSGIKAEPPKLNPHTPARSFSSSIIANANYNNPSVRSLEAATGSNMMAKHARQVGNTLYPLFCVSLYEHTWLSAGLGVWGKEEYVRRFFTVVNWKRVSETFRKFQLPGRRGSTEV